MSVRRCALVIAPLLLTGCGSSVDTGPAPAVTVTVTASPAPPTPTPTPTPTREETRTATAVSSATATGVLPPTATGRPLTLSEFFQPDDAWEEQRFDMASQSQVQGIGTRIDYCGDNYGEVLELRLSNSFDSLAFSAGQANDSSSSDKELVVEVLANNRQIDIQNVPFNEVRQFVEPVTGVNALQIRVYSQSTGRQCSQGGVIGVLTGATLT